MTASINNIDKKRIAKNTLLLYVRMFFMLAVGFFSVRLLLQNLGVTDYGLYNVIFGLVTMFSFFSGAMQSTVQRFLCHELGNKESTGKNKVFSVSLFLFLLLSLVILLAAETVGLWFVCNKLNVPPGRIRIAHIVYQISIFMTVFKVLQIPYISVVTSYENMGIYAKLSICDAILHLLSVVALFFIPDNRLISFCVFYTLSNLVILLSYVIYCHKKYDICRFLPRPDKEYLRKMLSFFSWNLFGAVASVSKQQGLNLLLNVFFGVILNAIWGIANQVGGAVNQFVMSFQQAFNPQILKSYANSPRNEYLNLLQNCSKYSFMLIWIVALPILLQTEFLLKLWLGKELPEGAVVFTQWIVIATALEALSGPLWMAVQATGNIRKYQLIISCFIGSCFVLSFTALSLKAPPASVVLINAVIGFLCLVFRILYLQKIIEFSVMLYFTKVLLPTFVICFCGYISGHLLKIYVQESWAYQIAYLCGVTILNLFFMLLFGFSKQEKLSLKKILSRYSV